MYWNRIKWSQNVHFAKTKQIMKKSVTYIYLVHGNCSLSPSLPNLHGETFLQPSPNSAAIFHIGLFEVINFLTVIGWSTVLSRKWISVSPFRMIKWGHITVRKYQIFTRQMKLVAWTTFYRHYFILKSSICLSVYLLGKLAINFRFLLITQEKVKATTSSACKSLWMVPNIVLYRKLKQDANVLLSQSTNATASIEHWTFEHLSALNICGFNNSCGMLRSHGKCIRIF